MGSKRHTAEEIVAKLRQVDVLSGQGRPIADAIRAIGVTEVTYCRWRNEYGGRNGDQVKRLKERRVGPNGPNPTLGPPGRAANIKAFSVSWGPRRDTDTYYNPVRADASIRRYI